jgi:hypothetical protein
MGNDIAHKRKARHNENFLSMVQRNDAGPNFVYSDWLVTVAFYIALQYVDAKLANLTPPLHPLVHSTRNNYVATNLPRQIADDYFFLKGKSEFARYFPDSERRISANMVNTCVNIALTKFI